MLFSYLSFILRPPKAFSDEGKQAAYAAGMSRKQVRTEAKPVADEADEASGDDDDGVVGGVIASCIAPSLDYSWVSGSGAWHSRAQPSAPVARPAAASQPRTAEEQILANALLKCLWFDSCLRVCCAVMFFVCRPRTR